MMATTWWRATTPCPSGSQALAGPDYALQLHDVGLASATIAPAGNLSGADLIDGDGGDDRLFGQGGGDSLDGDDGNDYVEGGDGGDTITGGDGADDLLGGSSRD